MGMLIVIVILLYLLLGIAERIMSIYKYFSELDKEDKCENRKKKLNE